MIIALSILHYVVCLVLIIVILLQVGKGHGLTGGSFGSDSSESVFGTKTATFLNKMTTAAAIAFLITSLSLGIVTAQRSKSLMSNVDQEELMKVLQEKMTEVNAEEATTGVVSDDAGAKAAVSVAAVADEVEAVSKDL